MTKHKAVEVIFLVAALATVATLLWGIFTYVVPKPIPNEPTPLPKVALSSPTPTKKATATPTPILTQTPSSHPTAVPSPGTIEVTVRQTMQQFCTYLYNADEDGAFSLLTPDAQQSYYQGNVQEFWDDFEEYSGNSGACNIPSCEVTACNVTFSSQAHPSCQDRFTFVDTGKNTWRITGWTSLNNGCG